MSLDMMVGTEIVSVTYDGDSLYFETNCGTYRATPYGDCCANCYIQHISGSEALVKGAVIASVEDISLPDVPEEDCCDVSEVWGHKIRTDKGWCTIEMRVDHNGYYGGSLSVDLQDTCPEVPALEDF